MCITSISPFLSFQIPSVRVEFMIRHMYYKNDLLFKEILYEIYEKGKSYCKNIVRFYPLKISEYFVKNNNKIMILFHNFYFEKISSIDYIVNQHRYSKSFLIKSSITEFSFNLKDILNCLSFYLFSHLLKEEYNIKDEFIFKGIKETSSKKKYTSFFDQFEGDTLNVVNIRKPLPTCFDQFEGDTLNVYPIH